LTGTRHAMRQEIGLKNGRDQGDPQLIAGNSRSELPTRRDHHGLVRDMPRDDFAVKANREGPNFRRQLLEEFAGLSWTNTLFFGCPILERIDRREFEFETAARFVEVRTSENGYVVSAPR